MLNFIVGHVRSSKVMQKIQNLSMDVSLLSKDNALVLRGVAIVFIVLHNFIHLGLWGFSRENEMSFKPCNADSFFSALTSGTNLIAEFFSHLGWIGVPVFIFLTGYGIALTPPPQSGSQSICCIKRNYLKILALMLPAVVFFAGVDILTGNLWPEVLKRISYLTMLANFAYPYLNCNPGVYWYFSLTFQFYLLWALLGRYMNGKGLLIWSVCLLVGLYGFGMYGSPNSLSIFRHCFTGWFPVFAIGVWLGISRRGEVLKPKNVWLELLLFVVLFTLILFLSKWMLSWMLVPIVALAWFIVLGSLLIRFRFLSELFRWVGMYSACIFVCHPIVRTIVLNTLYPRVPNLMINIVVYVVITIVAALLYSKIYKWLLFKMTTKTA